jgi:hypothetical protein
MSGNVAHGSDLWTVIRKSDVGVPGKGCFEMKLRIADLRSRLRQ